MHALRFISRVVSPNADSPALVGIAAIVGIACILTCGDAVGHAQAPLPPPLTAPEVWQGDLAEMATAPTDPLALPMTEQIAAGVVEPLPLAEQKVAWYERYPWLVIPMDGWENSIELGLNGSEGNSQTTSFQAGADLKRTTDRYTLSVDLDYQRTKSGQLETQNNGRLNVDFDRSIGDSAWTAFVKTGLEYDEFKAFDLRVNVNGGLGYYWVRDESTTLLTRFGAGASREIGAVDDSWVPEAVFGFEAARQLTARQKISGKLDYFPEWGDFNNFRIVSDVSWEILLDGVDNLSLKLAATDRYDSTPQGREPNDLFYSALLLWKF